MNSENCESWFMDELLQLAIDARRQFTGEDLTSAEKELSKKLEVMIETARTKAANPILLCDQNS